jgi:hypothetical protein
VNPVNDPPKIIGLPKTITFRSDSTAIIDLSDKALDIDSPDSSLSWFFETSNPSLICTLNDTINLLKLTAPRFQGEVNLFVTLEDDSNATDTDTVLVQVKEPTNITSFNAELPISYKLNQNYPNPFNPTTTISFEIPKDTYVNLNIYDLSGRLFIRLMDSYLSSGSYSVEFDASKLASGIYYYEMNTGEFRKVKKLIVAK